MTHSLHDKTYFEIDRLIFAGRGVSEPVGLRDVFSDEEIIDGLIEHPCWVDFPNHFQDWVFNTADAICTEELDSLR